MKRILGEEQAKMRGYHCWLNENDSFETLSSIPFSSLSTSSTSLLPLSSSSLPPPLPPTQSIPSISSNSSQPLQTTTTVSSSLIPTISPTPSLRRASFASNQRFYLIEIDPHNVNQINRKLYKYNPWMFTNSNGEELLYGRKITGNGSYCSGDKYSWQRYTSYLPVSGTFEINQIEQTLTFRPLQPLYPGTLYGILLANGVPSLTSSTLQSSSSSTIQNQNHNHNENEDWYTIEEDVIFYFQTTGTKNKKINNQERMKLNRHNIQIKENEISENSKENEKNNERIIENDNCRIT